MGLLEDIKNDSRLKDIKITESNLLLFSRYLDELDNCKGCRGLEKCKNGYNGMTPFIINNNEIGRRPCKYLIAERRKDNVNPLFDDTYLKDASLSDFKTDTLPRQKLAQYANELLAGSEKKGLYLCGPIASGKTYFLSLLANELAKKDIKSTIVFVPDLSRKLKGSIAQGKLEEMVEMLKTTEVLMLDDLGGEMFTSWLRDEILLPVLQYRYVNNKLTFISSNMTFEQLEAHFANEAEEGSDLKANRILQRIRKMTTRVVFASK